MPSKIDLLTSSQVIKPAPKRPALIIQWLQGRGITASLVKRIGG